MDWAIASDRQEQNRSGRFTYHKTICEELNLCKGLIYCTRSARTKHVRFVFHRTIFFGRNLCARTLITNDWRRMIGHSSHMMCCKEHIDYFIHRTCFLQHNLVFGGSSISHSYFVAPLCVGTIRLYTFVRNHMQYNYQISMFISPL